MHPRSTRTPGTARPNRATHLPPRFYANNSAPDATNFTDGHTLVYTPPPPPPVHRRAVPLPPVTPESARKWTRLRSINNPPELRLYENGDTSATLNVNAPEFRPSRPSSTRSVSSSSTPSIHSSSASIRSSSTSMSSSSTSATSAAMSVSCSGDMCPPPTARPAVTSTPVAEVDSAYKHYREKLHRTADVSPIVVELLEAAIGHYKYTHDAVHLATRVSPYAFCGAEEFDARMRTQGLGVFVAYWTDNGPWREERNSVAEYLNSRGVNIAGLIGSLYRYDFVSGHDVHWCIAILLTGRSHFRKLQAVHAMIVHCGNRVCAGKTGADTAILRARLSERHPDGRFVWACDEHDESHTLVVNLLETIDGWFASEEMAQIIANAFSPAHGH
ncbi:hypothetical protein C8R47DRAFT_1321276 [Mycena vitilis]|nr:hypothetical protein C8R47DRAFT_1321276 [Mycena vitilis]